MSALVRAASAVAAALLLAACDGAPAARPSFPAAATISPTSMPAPAPAAADWPTYHRDNARSGLGAAEPAARTLTPAWRATLDGPVYGQPLVVGGRVLAATEHDTVYALDPATGAVLWQRHVGTPVRLHDLPCGNIDPLGITSTMAYDAATGLVFALAETTGGAHTLYGLDVATGAVRLRRDAEPPAGEKRAHQQRSALTVVGAKVYVAYGGLAGDCGPYIGSVVAVPTSGTGPLLRYAIPTSREGGIWAPGGGIVLGDRLYYAVGNGEASGGTFDGSDSVIALDPDLHRTDLFAPAVWAEDNARDLDLGSLTPVAVGGRILIAGKRGTAYVLDPAHLGGVGGQLTETRVCDAYGAAAVDGATAFLPCRSGIQSVTLRPDGHLTPGWTGPDGVDGSPVVTGGAVWVVDYDGGLLYLLSPDDGRVRAKLAIGRAPHFASPTVAGGRGYVGTLTGVVCVTY